jgi:hypothetical protein
MIFWGWGEPRWACQLTNNTGNPERDYPQDGRSSTLTSNNQSYELCHYSTDWGGWRYFQFRAGTPSNSYTGKLDVKELLDWLVTTNNYSEELWVSRLEIGTEIDDGTKATVSFEDATFEINNQIRGVEFFDPNAVVSSSEEISSSEVVSSSAIISSSEAETSAADESSEATAESSEKTVESSTTGESSEAKESSETSALFGTSTKSPGTALMYKLNATQNSLTVQIAEDGVYDITFYDVLGNAVSTYTSETLQAGNNTLPVDQGAAEGLFIMKAIKQ